MKRLKNTKRGELSTDQIEKRFGEVTIELIKHAKVREIYLLDQQKRSLAYAITFFRFDKNNAEVARAHNIIKNGGMIGKTLREAGFVPERHLLWTGKVRLPKWLSNKFETPDEKAATQLLEFWITNKVGQRTLYAVIMEVLNPKYNIELSSSDVRYEVPKLGLTERIYLWRRGLKTLSN
ncbi:hypothetical protein ACFL1U_00730 [Patescibacteria group bacterium]